MPFLRKKTTARSASCFFSPVIIGTHCSRFLKSWWGVRLHLSWIVILISPGCDFAASHTASPIACYFVLLIALLPFYHASHNFSPFSLFQPPLLHVSSLSCCILNFSLPVISLHFFLHSTCWSSHLQQLLSHLLLCYRMGKRHEKATQNIHKSR